MEDIMSAQKLIVAASALLLAAMLGQDLHAQEAPAKKALERQEKLIVEQSLARLRETRKSLQSAIEKLASGSDAKTAQPAGAAPDMPGVSVQSPAIQQAEQALADVRRAIDELNVPQDRRQEVLDSLDDADSAMRMARQPDAESERKRLGEALEKVHKEIEIALQTLPSAPPPAER
jgi:hypothetical protein